MSDKITYGEWAKLFAKFPILRATSKREDVNSHKKEARNSTLPDNCYRKKHHDLTGADKEGAEQYALEVY